MRARRTHINIVFLLLALMLGAVSWLLHRKPNDAAPSQSPSDTLLTSPTPRAPVTEPAHHPLGHVGDTLAAPAVTASVAGPPAVVSTSFRETGIQSFSKGHPFRTEAVKILSGNLDETDSLNRHRILSYCEHLRTSYTTRDIDFIRQVYSDDALIIVGHVVKSDPSRPALTPSGPRVRYTVRSKTEYVERLTRIFNSGRDIDVRFSDFRIMRHPTMEGIYGVTLRQKYSSGAYSDDGYLFLLWDFRNSSMPLIHVRTWQPAKSIADTDDLIDISDFNLE